MEGLVELSDEGRGMRASSGSITTLRRDSCDEGDELEFDRWGFDGLSYGRTQMRVG